MHGAAGHHLDLVAVGQFPVDHPDVGDHAAVGVVDRVEDQRPRRSVLDALRRLDLGDDLAQQVLDAFAGLRRHPQYVGLLAADDVRQLGGVLLRLGARQVDLVQHRDDVQVRVQREVQVGQCLRLDALRRVDQQHRALTRLQRPGHLVGEVHVAGGVDHVQDVRRRLVAEQSARAVHGRLERQPHGLRLDRDAALALDVHPVQVLRPHRAAVDHSGDLQHPVGQRRLAVVDVGDDAEVPDQRRVGTTGLRNGRGASGHGRFQFVSGGRSQRAAGSAAVHQSSHAAPPVFDRHFITQRHTRPRSVTASLFRQFGKQQMR